MEAPIVVGQDPHKSERLWSCAPATEKSTGEEPVAQAPQPTTPQQSEEM